MGDNVNKKLEARIIVLGDSGVGKTSIFHRYTQDKFDDNSISTIGLSFSKKNYLLNNGENVVLKLVDTGGQEKYRAITRSYYKNADGVLFVFAHNDIESYNHIKEWINQFNENSNKTEIPKLLLGNKNDLPKFNENEESFNDFCKENNILKYISTSAKDNINIKETFREMVNNIYPNIKELKKQQNVKLKQNKKKKNCFCSDPDT